MDETLVRLVWQRSRSTCEYCRLPQAFSKLPFHIDHIKARKHSGRAVPGNLALACFYCNSYKGPNIVARIPAPGPSSAFSTRAVTNGSGIFAGTDPC